MWQQLVTLRTIKFEARAMIHLLTCMRLAMDTMKCKNQKQRQRVRESETKGQKDKVGNEEGEKKEGTSSDKKYALLAAK